MKTSWLQGLEPDVSREMKADYIAAKRMRARLIVLAEAKIKESQTASILKDGYESPNWAYKQADNVGFQRGIKELISLISDD